MPISSPSRRTVRSSATLVAQLSLLSMVIWSASLLAVRAQDAPPAPPASSTPTAPVTLPGRPTLGINLSEALIVTTLAKGWPAERAGLRVGDRLLALNGQNVTSSDEFIRRARLIPAGTNMLKVLRADEVLTLTVVVLPPAPAAPAATSPQTSLDREIDAIKGVIAVEAEAARTLPDRVPSPVFARRLAQLEAARARGETTSPPVDFPSKPVPPPSQRDLDRAIRSARIDLGIARTVCLIRPNDAQAAQTSALKETRLAQLEAAKARGETAVPPVGETTNSSNSTTATDTPLPAPPVTADPTPDNARLIRHTGAGPEGIFSRRNPIGILIGTSYVYPPPEYYTVFPDGVILNVLPNGGLDYVSLDGLEHNSPTNFGTYTVAGDTLRITWGSGAHSSLDIEAGPGGRPVLKGFLHPGRFPTGQKLAGNWVHSAGNAAVGRVQSLSFHDDGSFASSNVGYTTVGGSQGTVSGAYEISGNSLTVTLANGSVGRKTIYSLDPPTSTTPTLINVDGDDFTQE